MIDSVIFDCDGTLLDSMPAWHATAGRFAQKAGIALNPMQLVRLNANTLPETAAFFHRECGLGGSVPKRFWMMPTRSFLANIATTFWPETARWNLFAG